MSPFPIQGHVVVGVDGSPASLAALRWAAHEADRRQTALHVIFGLGQQVSLAPIAWPTVRFHDEAKQLVADLVSAAQRLAPRVAVTGEVANCTPDTALLDESARAAVVVVGAHGNVGLTDLRIGTVAGRVATHAQCSVVVVPADHRPDASTHRRIVVGVDGSQVAGLAAWFALEEATLRQAPLTAVRAVPDAGAELVELERRRLAAVLDRWAAAFPRVRVDLRVVGGDPVQALLTAADGGQLLVVGSRGLSGLRGRLLGSVSLRLLHHARTPVAVVHPHHHDAGHLRLRKLVATG
jgi:nucleotide-binding universal stress UspA family protein